MDGWRRVNLEPRYPCGKRKPARSCGRCSLRRNSADVHQLLLERQDRASVGSCLGIARREDENLRQLWRYERRHEAAARPDLVGSTSVRAMHLPAWSGWDIWFRRVPSL